MRTGCLCFLMGVIGLTRLPALPPAALLWLLPFCIIGLRRSAPAFYLAMFCLGFLWALWRADVVLAKDLPTALEGGVVRLTGHVDSLPAIRGRRVQFDFAVALLRDAAGKRWPSPGRVRLSWYVDWPELVPGARWRLWVKLKRPHGFANPGGFDYEAWLFQRHVRATGYVLAQPAAVRVATGDETGLDTWRWRISRRLQAVVGVHGAGAIIQALVLGDRSFLSQEQWRVFTATGSSHLMAISGLHIGLVAALCFLLGRHIWMLVPFLRRFLPAQRAAATMALVGAVIYAALAGFSVPTQRALIMLFVLCLATGAGQRLQASQVLAMALFAVLLVDPFCVLTPGVWLSFGAVAVISWVLAARVGHNTLLNRWSRVQVAVAMGLIPVLGLWFQRIPPYGVVANLLAVPWMGTLVVPLALSGSVVGGVAPGPGAWLLALAVRAFDWLWPALEWLASMPAAQWPLPGASLWAAALAAAGCLIILLPRGIPGRWLGVCWLLPLFWPAAGGPQTGAVRVTLLDVGQGLATVVQTQRHVLLFDTGARFSDSFNAGAAVIRPYLRKRGITEVNLLIVSHGDNDHIGGLTDILRHFPVGPIITSVPARISHAVVKPCRRGQSWRWDGVEFRILHPPPGPGLSGNDGSCVLQISAAGKRVLLTGDIEREAERELMHRFGGQLRANVLVAPHHGSSTSSTYRFVGTVQPEIVLFPVGYLNRFGFPKQDIIERYKDSGARILDTAHSGAIELSINTAGITISRFRIDGRRFWQTPF